MENNLLKVSASQGLMGARILTTHHPQVEGGQGCAPIPPYTGDLDLPKSLCIEASLIFCLQIAPISHLHSNYMVVWYETPLESYPQPSHCRACFFLFLSPLPRLGERAGPSASGESNFPPSDFCVRRPGVTEVGKHKIELGRMDGAWGHSNLIFISAFF